MTVPRILSWLVADDPHPEYSRLDRMDGLGSLDQPDIDPDDTEETS